MSKYCVLYKINHEKYNKFILVNANLPDFYI